jgi:CubicO group peptidase (beta-lactamase class C family)
MKTLVLAACLALVGVASSPDRLDRAIRAEMSREHVPGLTFAVVRHGRVVRTGAYGYANLEWRTPATVDTKFEIASISKMFVGAAVRLLVEAGSLDPEDPVSKYLGPLPDAWRGMKVRHLITMSSGLPEDFASELIPYDQDVTTPYDDASMVRAFFTLKMPAGVGERNVYGSPNYTMLSMIVAKISGMPFRAFVRQRIFVPAGMADSSYIDNSAVVPRRAEGYRRAQDGSLRKGWYLGQYLHARPDDGVLTTAPDLAKWLIALEQRRVLKEPERLWDPTVADSGRPLDYGYGWMQETWLGHRRLDHSGGLRTGFHSFVARYPDDDLSVVVLTNCDFSLVRNYVNLIVRTYLPDVPDPAVERTTRDADPPATARLVSALQRMRQGRVDETVMEASAIDPPGVDEIRDFLTHAGPFTFAGRARVPSRGLAMHGHALVDYETLRTQIDGDDIYVTLYRDASGKIAYVELTN